MNKSPVTLPKLHSKYRHVIAPRRNLAPRRIGSNCIVDTEVSPRLHFTILHFATVYVFRRNRHLPTRENSRSKYHRGASQALLTFSLGLQVDIFENAPRRRIGNCRTGARPAAQPPTLRPFLPYPCLFGNCPVNGAALHGGFNAPTRRVVLLRDKGMGGPMPSGGDIIARAPAPEI